MNGARDKTLLSKVSTKSYRYWIALTWTQFLILCILFNKPQKHTFNLYTKTSGFSNCLRWIWRVFSKAGAEDSGGGGGGGEGLHCEGGVSVVPDTTTKAQMFLLPWCPATHLKTFPYTWWLLQQIGSWVRLRAKFGWSYWNELINWKWSLRLFSCNSSLKAV